MTSQIHPDALRKFRDVKNLTQKELSNATSGKGKVSEVTIKRIEGKKDGIYRARGRVAEELAKALGVDLAKLALAPTPEAEQDEVLRKSGYRRLSAMIDRETALAFNMVQHLYGIPIKSQIEMAPLFMALLAEGSLEWRRKRVAEIERAASHLQSLGGGHLSFTVSAYRAEDGAAAERKSIEKKDLFAVHVSDDAFDFGFDPSLNNPFADYLKDFAKDVQAQTITFDHDFGWKTNDGLPNYVIGAKLIEQITGGDSDAEYALLQGHVKLKSIPESLLKDEKTEERVAWMISHIPEEELSTIRTERELQINSLDLSSLGNVGEEKSNA
jgi:transcriptional regulator with XRE-family HTH domain